MARRPVLERVVRALGGLLAALGLLTGLAGAGCASFAGQGFWGPFRGQFIDLDTGQPIQGAVIAAVWYEEQMTPVSSAREFYAAEAAVADREGRFEIPSPGRPALGLSVTEPSVTWFAPGYKRVGVAVTPPRGTRFVDPTVIQLRRRAPGEAPTNVEVVQGMGVRLSQVPGRRYAEIEQTVNRQRQALGLPAVSLSTGEIVR